MKFKWWLLIVGLLGIFLALAFKNPYKQNNLISNLEPYPDTFYYSVPAWNLVHNKGFKMEAYGKEISRNVPPLYGLYLAPFFKIFNDVRSYYFANMLLCFGSILFFVRLTAKFFEKSKIRWWLTALVGFVLVTNFYFYNLPTLMMAENLQIFLILATVNLLLEKFDFKNVIFLVIIGLLLWFSKASNFPVIVCLIFWLGIKIFKSKFWKNYSKKTVCFLLFLLTIILGVFIYKIIYPNLSLLVTGNQFFSIYFAKKNLPMYISEFFGKNGYYLWYANQQIENIAGYLALFGILIGLCWKKYRLKTLILLSVILAVIVFHSFMYSSEGRYISVVIPLYIIFIAMIPELLSKVKFGYISIVIIILSYLAIRQNINGFTERKFTSIKRQILNNQLNNNENPWNYEAIESINSFFNINDKNVYLGSLLPPFYFYYFSNNNYQYLPISERQEFGDGKGYLQQIYPKDESLLDYYDALLKSGKKVYVSNYYLNNHNDVWIADYRKLETKFAFREVKNDCMELCKIYQVELKKK